MLVRFLLVICGWSFILIGGLIAMAWIYAIRGSDISDLSLGLFTFGGAAVCIPLIAVGALLLGIDKIIDELQLLNKSTNERLNELPNPVTHNDPQKTFLGKSSFSSRD
jgi:hypothetical protein